MDTDDVEEARRIIELDGEDGYRTAAEIVGPDKADELLTDLVARNMGTTPDDEEVRKFVTGVRVRKGFVVSRGVARSQGLCDNCPERANCPNQC